ncbi:EF-hand domain-containing protein D1 [Plecturocebus cupreus]
MSPRPAIRRHGQRGASGQAEASAPARGGRGGRPQPAALGAPTSEPELEPPARAPTASADPEPNAQLSRRLDMNEAGARPRRCRVFSPYTEFPAFSRRLLRTCPACTNGPPGPEEQDQGGGQDVDGKLSFREFPLISHKPATRKLQEDSGLTALAKLCETEVALERVKGA